MLGNDYAGYFATGDARALAELLLRCRADQGETGTPVMQRLMDQCARRAPLFAQANERACLHQLVSELHAGC